MPLHDSVIARAGSSGKPGGLGLGGTMQSRRGSERACALNTHIVTAFNIGGLSAVSCDSTHLANTRTMKCAATSRAAVRHAIAPLAAAIGCALLFLATPAQAANPAQATSSRAAREDAARSIPWNKLDPEFKAQVSSTLEGTSLFRRLPVQVTECDPDLYLFLVRHPEVIVSIWEAMNISNVALQRTGDDTFRASDGAGTLCDVKFGYSDHETQVIYAEGTYEGPMFSQPIRASACWCSRAVTCRTPTASITSPAAWIPSSRFSTSASKSWPRRYRCSCIDRPTTTSSKRPRSSAWSREAPR